jgi:hypothetical protein
MMMMMMVICVEPRAIALVMVAASISETSVSFYQITWGCNPEDSHLHTHRRENVKF